MISLASEKLVALQAANLVTPERHGKLVSYDRAGWFELGTGFLVHQRLQPSLATECLPSCQPMIPDVRRQPTSGDLVDHIGSRPALSRPSAALLRARDTVTRRNTAPRQVAEMPHRLVSDSPGSSTRSPSPD